MRYTLFICFACFLFACGNNKTDEPPVAEDSAIVKYSWEASDTGRLALTKRTGIGPDTLSPEAMTVFMNKNYPNVQLEIVKTSGDTLYLKIPEATYLTQQMGSTGPEIYFAEAVYNLTEIPGIHYVHFDFEEGDHAQPGTFSRDSFKDK